MIPVTSTSPSWKDDETKVATYSDGEILSTDAENKAPIAVSVQREINKDNDAIVDVRVATNLAGTSVFRLYFSCTLVI